MKSLSSWLTVLIACACLCVLLWDRCGSSEIPTDHKVDSIKVEIQKRDSFIVSRDTVIYRINTVRDLVHEVRTETDTILKLIKCDSLAVACDSLAVQYNRQDSIFREQISDYKLLTEVQDSLLRVKPKRRWIIVPIPIILRRR